MKKARLSVLLRSTNRSKGTKAIQDSGKRMGKRKGRATRIPDRSGRR